MAKHTYFRVLATILSPCLFAQDVDFEFRKEMHRNSAREEGFTLDGGVSMPFSYGYSKSRLGIASGNYLDITGRVKLSLHYSQLGHDWSTSFFMGETYSINPSVKNRLVKSEDILDAETRYLYQLNKKMSPFVLARLHTSAFSNVDIHDSEIEYDLRDVDNVSKEILSAKEIKLSDPFFPLFLTENAGLIYTPLHDESFTLEIRAAASFRQTLAANQKVYAGEKQGYSVIRDLRSFYQIGPLAGTSISGALLENRLTYHAGIDATWPAWQNKPHVDRTFLDSLVLEANAGLSYDIADYANLSYAYTMLRLPDIVNKFQQHHALNLNLTFAWTHNFGVGGSP